MPATTPTMDEFNALVTRVTNIEKTIANMVTPPPVTQPPVTQPPVTQPPVTQPPSTTGVQAKRIASMVELLGYNTFSSVDTGNVWGSWPADYRAETVAACFDYMYKGSGYCPPIREYHYAGRESWQTPWIRKIKSLGYPDIKGTVCVGANGSVNDVASIIKMTTTDGDVWKWGEGINEPNTDFGSGQIPASRTIDIQKALQGSPNLMGPSIVFGLPGADGWIKGYFNNDMTVINSLLKYANGHYYPPHCPDIIGDGTSMSEVIGSLWNVYGNKPVQLTEVHSTLYNQDRGKKKADGTPVLSNTDIDILDAYYMLLMLFRAATTGVGLWWYALLDYAQTYRCGMFPTNAANPRLVASAVKRLTSVAPDTGDRYGFTPEKLDVSVSGTDNRTGWSLYQASNKKFYIPLWRADNKPGGTAIPIKFTFANNMQVQDYDLLSSVAPRVQTGTSYTSSMPYGCRMLVVTPG